jgi:hypothetical protein
VIKTLILHVGYPKTGTSSLQWFLHTHRDHLLEQGVCYPVTGQVADHAHHKLAFSLADNAYEQVDAGERARLFEALASELDGSGAHTAVLSSELFLYRLELIQKSEECQRLLSGRTISVVCFLRNQTTFMESLYRHFVWDAAVRFAEGPEKFLQTYPFAGDYYATLCAWAAAFGKTSIVPIIYEQALHGDGCIMRFCRVTGIDVDGLPERDFDEQRNVTVTADLVTEVMRIANGYPDLTRPELIELGAHARAFAEAIGHLPLPRHLFTPDLLARIQTMFAESNRRLSEEFVRQPLDGSWFDEHRSVVDARV